MVREASTLTRLARLRREVARDLSALDARSGECASLLQSWNDASFISRAELTLVAVNLHAYYTALETLLERVAVLLDDETPKGAAWHIELIAQMTVEIPGLRPARVPEAFVAALLKLRRFRHFFRNAYVLDLDPLRVREHARRLAQVHRPLRDSLMRFQTHLDDLIGGLQT